MDTIHDTEKQALVGNRDAVTKIVSSFRLYRQTLEKYLLRKWRNGALDGATTFAMENELEDILNNHFKKEGE